MQVKCACVGGGGGGGGGGGVGGRGVRVCKKSGLFTWLLLLSS